MVQPARNDRTLDLYKLANEARQAEFDDNEEVTLVGGQTPDQALQDPSVFVRVSKPVIVLITSWKNEYLRLAVIALIIAGFLGAYFLYKIEVAAPTSVNLRPSKSPAAGSSSDPQPQP